MTDKVVIDGVDVRTCDSFIDYYMVDETRFQDVPEDIIEQDKLPMIYKGLPDCLLRKNLCNAHICHCKDKPNCHFKQLARKTQELEQYKASKQASYEALQKQCNELELQNRKLKQECEALKSESFTREELITIQEKDIDRYREALEEIEEVYETAMGSVTTYDEQADLNITIEALHNISDIINKAKGEGNGINNNSK